MLVFCRFWCCGCLNFLPLSTLVRFSFDTLFARALFASLHLNSNSQCNEHFQLEMIDDRSKNVLQTESCCTFFANTDLIVSGAY